jgi:hypothetical protein
MGIALFGGLKAGNFSLRGWGWRRNPSEGSLGMGTEFYPPLRGAGDSVPEHY